MSFLCVTKYFSFVGCHCFYLNNAIKIGIFADCDSEKWISCYVRKSIVLQRQIERNPLPELIR